LRGDENSLSVFLPAGSQTFSKVELSRCVTLLLVVCAGSAFLSLYPITCATSPAHHPPASRYADFSRSGE
jgi:hypothetical protein